MFLNENKHLLLTVMLENGPFNYIEEGLIKTYPIERVVSHIADAFDISNKEEDIEYYEENGEISTDINGLIFVDKGYNDAEVIHCIVPIGVKGLSQIDRLMLKYGYIKGSVAHAGDCDDIWYEKKFDDKANELLKNQTYLYHICPIKVLNRVLTKGLIPKDSQWIEFTHNSRVYLFINKPSEYEFKYFCNNFRSEKNTNDPMALLRINIRDIENIDYYIDPRMPNAVYTYDNISPKIIEVVTQEKI